MQDVILPRHPSEPHAQGHQPRVLAERKLSGSPLLLAVVEEMALIPFEHWPRDFDGIGEAALLAPLRGRSR